jgi:hypothetical protein
LYSEADGVTSNHYFEQIVEIPDDANLFSEGECWLVVMPVAPGDVASMTQAATIVLFALSMEIVADDATAADRALFGLLGSNGYGLPAGLGEGGFRERYLIKNPIYVPEVYPLRLYNVGPRFGTPVTDNSAFEISNNADDSLRLQVGGTFGPFFASQDLPWGSSVLRAGFSMERSAGTGDLSDIRLRQVLGYPVGSSGYAGRRTQILIDWADSATTQFYEAGAYRNRIGDFWPDQSTLTNPVDLADGTNGAAEVVFEVGVGTAGTTNYFLNTGYIVVAVDPRMRGGYFKRKP